MLNYFDHQNLCNEQIERLAKNASDYQKLFRILPKKKKIFTFKSNDESLLVAVPIEYDGYEMEVKLRVNPAKKTHLQCGLYRDATKMTSCIPEYTISIIDKESSRTITIGTILKSDEYVTDTLKAITDKATQTGRGWDEFIQKTKFVDKKQYILKVELKGLAPLP